MKWTTNIPVVCSDGGSDNMDFLNSKEKKSFHGDFCVEINTAPRGEVGRQRQICFLFLNSDTHERLI